MERLFDLNHPAAGAYFYGREREIEFFEKNLFEPAAGGSSRYYSLTGMNRIGKSSLMRELCRRFCAAGNPGVYVLETSLEQAGGFWRYWIFCVLKPLFSQPGFDGVLAGMEPEDAALVREIRDYFFDKAHWTPLFEDDAVEDMVAKDYLGQLFPILYDAGKYIILVIDEFDKAGKVFGLREENFGWFRGLLQSNDRGLSVVTISRRSIRFIEQNCFGGSTFDGIFSKRGLFGYSNSELDAYFALLEQNGLALDEARRREIWYYCGRSPYYLAIMAEALLRDPSLPPQTVSGQFIDSFEAVISLLREESLLTPMLQMFVGPRYDLSQSGLQRLVAMGYCMNRSALYCRAGGEDEYADYFDADSTGEYLTACGFFVDYLHEVNQNEVDNIWPKLSATERRLRKTIEGEYKKLYPGVWKQQLKAAAQRNGAKELHESFLRKHEAVYRRAGEEQQKAVGNTILNVVSLRLLGDLIEEQWSVFQKYFSCPRRDFSAKIDQLYRARNPISHSNGELLTPLDIAAVEEICDQFNAGIERAGG